MTGVMGILAGEDKINYREEMVAPSVLAPRENPNII